MSKDKGGRPTVFTPEVVNKLEGAFALDATVEEACFYAGISRQTYYENIKKQPELADRFDGLRTRPVLLARQTVIKNISFDAGLAMEYLRRKRKVEFSDRTETDMTTKGEIITPTHDIMKLAAEISQKLKEKKTKK